MTIHSVDYFLDVSEENFSKRNIPKRPEMKQNVGFAAAPRKIVKKSGTIPCSSDRELRRVFLVAEVTFMNSCIDFFKKVAVASGVEIEIELSVKPV